jgi:hypothetical protein
MCPNIPKQSVLRVGRLPIAFSVSLPLSAAQMHVMSKFDSSHVSKSKAHKTKNVSKVFARDIHTQCRKYLYTAPCTCIIGSEKTLRLAAASSAALLGPPGSSLVSISSSSQGPVCMSPYEICHNFNENGLVTAYNILWSSSRGQGLCVLIVMGDGTFVCITVCVSVRACACV